MTKSKPVLLLLVSVLLAAACSGSRKLVSIDEHPLDQATKTDHLNTGNEIRKLELCRQIFSTASGSVPYFAGNVVSLPCPVVIWAGHGGGIYQTKLYQSFVEVIWSTSDSEKKIRESMKKRVPPIMFQSRNAADFLTMWHDISGMEFKYDPDLIEDSIRYDRRRLWEESDPELPFPSLPQRIFPPGFPSGFVQFQSSESCDVGDFMPRLAAYVGGSARKTLHGWVIEKFQRNKQDLQLIEDCISLIKKGPFFVSPESIEILSRIGAPALPEILREFQPVIIDRNINTYAERQRKFERLNSWVESSLAKVLSQISSPERDEALLKYLKNSPYSTEIIEALGASNCQAAAPIIEQIASRPNIPHEMRVATRIALNALGRPPASPEQEKDLIIAPSVRKALQTEKAKEALALLRAVLYQCDQYQAGMELKSVDVDSSDSMILEGIVCRAPQCGKPSQSWRFEVPVLRADRALIRFSYVCGRLCGEGYFGKLKNLEGRWAVTKWQRLWVS
jgi:hypothetical protein